jgi:8-oxo-dGTP diphosphatase
MKKTAVCLIIENSKGEILLLLRDNKEGIPFPNQWYILGGSKEEEESPEEAIRREMKEEIELELPELPSPKVFDWPEKLEYVYHVKLDLDLSNLPLNEGQRLQYFSPEEINGMELAFHDNKIVMDHFSTKGEIREGKKLH